ncbi:N-acetyltransferase family protein [Arenibacterium sp. CAU 1754]
MSVSTRAMVAADVPAACRILNHIIDAGGTTAYLNRFEDVAFKEKFLSGEKTLFCHVALDEQGDVVGFQWVGLNPQLPPDCGDIATFARRDPPVRGVGRSLFAATCKAAGDKGLSQINATIRADNVPGLAYYSKIGFRDHSVARDIPLADGVLVDRVSKRFVLNA